MLKKSKNGLKIVSHLEKLSLKCSGENVKFLRFFLLKYNKKKKLILPKIVVS